MSKYRGLAAHLEDLAEQGVLEATLTFAEIENLIGGPLPRSAVDHTPTFWSNDSVGRTNSREGWLRVGWRSMVPRQGERQVTFVYSGDAPSKRVDKGTEWTPAEVAIAVRWYLALQRHLDHGGPLPKKRFIERAMEDLPGRTRSSVERRFGNIAAMLQRVGLPWIPGFPPLTNTGKAGATILEALNDQGVVFGGGWLQDAALESASDLDEPWGEPDLVTRSVLLRRGQQRFRRALLDAYEGRCAVSGCAALPALEAAHIIPYASARRQDPGNGLLLRADIHTLFDLHLLSVGPDGAIFIDPGLREDPSYGPLHGQPAKLPPAPHAPSPDALRRHWLIARGKAAVADGEEG